MIYHNIQKATFLSRPNRFIAICEIDGQPVRCHVKNTGRCRELLISGCTVYLEKSDKPSRKTAYDLVSVEKGGALFNIDSQAPNRAVRQWLEEGGLWRDVTLLRPEAVYGGSRFDFYAEHGGKRAFLEVKGVTLEEDGVLLFPDAPTLRGLKHLRELQQALSEGYEAYLIFLVQTERADCFAPNRAAQPAFADALAEARSAGVQLLCMSCHTTPKELRVKAPVKICL